MKATQINRVHNILRNVVSLNASEVVRLAHPGNESSPILVSTLNLQHLRHCADSEDFYRIYKSSRIIVSDGMPIVWLSRLLLGRKISRLTGVEICALLLSQDSPVLVLGSNVETLAAACKAVQSKRNIPIYDDYFNPANEAGYLEIAKARLKKLAPSYVILALGSPKQELLFRDLVASGLESNITFFGLGGSLDILSGQKSRAPRLLQKTGFEWIWRLGQSPKYLFWRYLSDGRFLMKLLFSRVRMGRSDNVKDHP